MSSEKSTRIEKGNESVIEEISITPAGSPDSDILDRLTSHKADRVRKKTRMARTDIKASLRPCGMFRSKIFRPVRLLDISQLGAAVATEHLMRLKSKVQLKLNFKDGMEFIISARITRSIEGSHSCYGLSFLRLDHALNEHLLRTSLKHKLST